MFSVAILDLMNPNQVNQMNPMQQHQMNQHMMSMQQQQQNFMNQNQMMNPMQQFNQSAQYSQPQAQHQQQHAVLLVSNLDPEVSNSKKKKFLITDFRKLLVTIYLFYLAFMEMSSVSKFCTIRRITHCFKCRTVNRPKQVNFL